MIDAFSGSFVFFIFSACNRHRAAGRLAEKARKAFSCCIIILTVLSRHIYVSIIVAWVADGIGVCIVELGWA